MFITDRCATSREIRGHCYLPSSFYFSKLVVDAFCLRIIPAILFFVPFYFMMGLRMDANAPGVFLGILLLVNIAAGGLSTICGMVS